MFLSYNKLRPTVYRLMDYIESVRPCGCVHSASVLGLAPSEQDVFLLKFLFSFRSNLNIHFVKPFCAFNGFILHLIRLTYLRLSKTFMFHLSMTTVKK